jgi:hypothetical protein
VLPGREAEYAARIVLPPVTCAAPALAALLEVLARNSVARRIHILCWSAGGRVVNDALRRLHERRDGSPGDLRDAYRPGTVYFAADVPGDEFLANLPDLNAVANRIGVTVSSNDGALNMAQRFTGGGARIGPCRQDLAPEQLEQVQAADRLEVVDVSRGSNERGFDIIGHRYCVSHPWASSDVNLAVRSDPGPGGARAAADRPGHPVAASRGLPGPTARLADATRSQDSARVSPGRSLAGSPDGTLTARVNGESEAARSGRDRADRRSSMASWKHGRSGKSAGRAGPTRPQWMALEPDGSLFLLTVDRGRCDRPGPCHARGSPAGRLSPGRSENQKKQGRTPESACALESMFPENAVAGPVVVSRTVRSYSGE